MSIDIQHLYFIVKIKCPECGQIQHSTVKNGSPWPSYVHTCHKCDYIIMESEWESIEPFAGYYYENKFDPKGAYVRLLSPLPANYENSFSFMISKLLWRLRDPANRKPYDKFYYGLIKHEHDFTNNCNPVLYDTKFKWYYTRCRHYGCNVIHPIHD